MLKRLLTGAILALLATAVQAAGLYPLSNQQVLDSNSKVMSGARLFLYDGGTTTPRIAYKDLALTTPHPNPILADSSGRLPLIYLDDGYYRQRLTTRTGTLIFDQDGIPVLTTSAGGAGTTVDPDSVLKTGDYKHSYDDQPQSGFVRANGRTIGSAASGSTERANADTQPLYEKLWAFTNITVSGGKGASAAADYAANKPLVLPNAAGRGLIGSDDLGAGTQSVVTSATCTAPTLPGATCGAQVITIAASNLPVSSPWLATATTSGSTSSNGDHTHNYSGNTGNISALHNHSVTYVTASNPNSSVQSGSGATAWFGQQDASATVGTNSVDHNHTFSGTTTSGGAHTHTLSATTTVAMQSNGGGGQAVTNLPPVLTSMIYLRL